MKLNRYIKTAIALITVFSMGGGVLKPQYLRGI